MMNIYRERESMQEREKCNYHPMSSSDTPSAACDTLYTLVSVAPDEGSICTQHTQKSYTYIYGYTCTYTQRTPLRTTPCTRWCPLHLNEGIICRNGEMERSDIIFGGHTYIQTRTLTHTHVHTYARIYTHSTRAHSTDMQTNRQTDRPKHMRFKTEVLH